jgi:hypothetical protein
VKAAKRFFGSALVGLTLCTSTVAADEATPSPDGGVTEPEDGTKVLALGATLLPGIVVHGSGHWVLGRERAAGKLLLLEAIGVGLLFAGISNLVATNASRYMTRSSVVLIGLGTGFFMVSSMADVYGVAVPLDSRGAPLRRLAAAQAELGYQFVISPALPQHHFVMTRVDLRWHELHLQPTLWHAIDEPAARQRLQVGYRAYGPTQSEQASDGSFVQLEAAVTRHALPQEGSSTLTYEVFTHGRLDLERLDPTLTGMFGLAGLGVGLQMFDYDGIDGPVDRESLLLLRSGFGVYLGEPDGHQGEIAFYYDNRHDDFAGGLNDRAVGIPGYVALAGHGFFGSGLGLGAHLDVGANVVGGVSWLVRSP